MRTEFLLLAQYDGKTTIPLDVVCRDFFSHLSVEKFMRKVGTGEIVIPVIRMDGSQKAAKAVHVNDLAAYLDKRRDMALKEVQQLTRSN